MLKSYRWVGWGGVGGPWDFIVIPSPFGLDFGTLDLGLRDLGLTIVIIRYFFRFYILSILQPRKKFDRICLKHVSGISKFNNLISSHPSAAKPVLEPPSKR